MYTGKDEKQNEPETERVIASFEVARWIAGELGECLGEEGRLRLQAWLSEARENEILYRELKQEIACGRWGWKYSRREVERQLKQFHDRRRKKYLLLRGWSRWVAAVVLLLGITTVIRWQVRETPLHRPVEPIVLAKQNVTLILPSGETVVLNDTLRMVEKEKMIAVRVPGREIVYRDENPQQHETKQHTLVVPRGTEFKVQLADGTRVWVNSCTEFRYPLQFTGDRRVVYLKGEAYFEVAPDKDKPFIVQADGGVNVRVLGTRFNVSAYEKEANVTTTLAEGSVELILPGQSRRIKPGEQLIFDKGKGSFTVKQVDAAVYSAWKEGKFIFENQDLEQIMDRLQLWYEIGVFYADEEAKHYRFTGDLKKYDSFEKIVRMIEEVAGVKITIKNKSVIIGTNG